MFDNVSLDSKLQKYETTIVDFFDSNEGHVLIISDDNTFFTILRQTITKLLGVQSPVFTTVNSVKKIESVIRTVFAQNEQVIVFLERVCNRHDLLYLVDEIKETYPHAKIILLTSEVAREQLVFLHEVGADNVIAKPISINMLIEKLAFTIKPQNKLGQLIDLSKKMLACGAYSQALNASKSILQMKPNSAAGLIVMGDAYLGLKNYKNARAAYEMASKAAPMYLEPLKKQVSLYESLGDFQNRLRCLNKLDGLSPLNLDRKITIGEAYMELGSSEHAEFVFDTAIEMAANESHNAAAEIAKRVADIYEKADPKSAEKYLKTVLKHKGNTLSENDLALFTSLGVVLRKQGKLKEAIEEYSKALEVSQNDANVYYHLAVALAEGRDYYKASDALHKVLRLNNNFGKTSPSVAYNMGFIFSKSRENKMAREMLADCLAMSPTHKKATSLLATLQAKAQR